MSYRLEDSFRAGPGWSYSKDVFKPVWQTPVSSVQWINSWWWVEELPETCRVSCRSEFGKLVHLVGFIIKKLYRSIAQHLAVALKEWHQVTGLLNVSHKPGLDTTKIHNKGYSACTG